MKWWQHLAELNVATTYMMVMLPSIQWQINPTSDTVHVQWPDWLAPQHTSKMLIHPSPGADTNYNL
jgi:hypothetical protein